MATLDRIEPAFTPWTPSASGLGVAEDDDYVGRHRKADRAVSFSLRRLFYAARHRTR